MIPGQLKVVMGEANRKGKTFEERKAFAIARDSMKPFPHVNVITPSKKSKMSPGHTALMAFFALAESQKPTR